MLIYSKTDTGKVRETNQDAFFCCELPDGSVFAMVCDGMGGANAGNLASETAIKSIRDYVINSYRTNMDDVAIEKMLKNSIVSANIQIYDMALKDKNLLGMGTTAVVSIVREDMAVISHVGDSRCYKINDDILQLTKDHSVVQSLIETGKIKPEEAKFHPRKNVITRAIGAEENILPDTFTVSFSKGDSLLLCSDGLTNFVDTCEIKKIFDDFDGAFICEKLIEEANSNGGGDNITVVTVTV